MATHQAASSGNGNPGNGQSGADGFLANARAIAAAGTAAVLADGTVKAIAREAIKDVRSTIHEVFFGRPEGASEPGTPLTPLHSEIAAERGEAAGGTAWGAEAPGSGQMHASLIGKWQQRELDREEGSGGGQNELAKGRSLPAEELLKAKEIERDGRGR